MQWSSDNQPTRDESVATQRTDELYKLTRTLLATGFRGLQSRKRSKQLDEIQTVLSAFAFVDEADALEYAKAHLKDVGSNSRSELPDEFLDEEAPQAAQKVIPILSDTSVAE